MGSLRKGLAFSGRRKSRRRLGTAFAGILLASIMMISMIPASVFAEDICTCDTECTGASCACDVCVALIEESDEAHAASCSCFTNENQQEVPQACTCDTLCTGAENCACSYCGEGGANHVAEGIACTCGASANVPAIPENTDCEHGNEADTCEACKTQPDEPMVLMDTFSLDALATFDGTDLSDDDGGLAYTDNDFAHNAKTLTVNAKFTNTTSSVSVTERTVIISIGVGLEFDTLPGFRWKNGTWEYDNSLLPDDKQSAVVSARFEANTAELGGKLRTLKSGTVTYVLNDNNVTAITLEPTVKYDTVFMANGTVSGSNQKLLENAVTVTTTERRNGANAVQVGSETLEILKVSGEVGAFVYVRGTNAHYLAKNESTTLRFLLLARPESFTLTTHWDEFYFKKASFVLNLPKGIGLDISDPSDPTKWNDALTFETVSGTTDNSVFEPENPSDPWRMQITDVSGDGAGGWNITFEVNDVYVGPNEFLDNEYKSFSLKIRANDEDVSTDMTRLTVGGSAHTITPYGDYAEMSAGYTSNRFVFLRKKVDTTVTISWLSDSAYSAESKAFNGVGYVPKSAMDLANNDSTVLGSYYLLNQNSTPTGKQTIRVDFSGNGTGGGRARVLRLPVGPAGEVPKIQFKLAGGPTHIVENYKTYLRTSEDGLSDFVVFDLAKLTALSISPTDYIEWIEYEIDDLVASYRSAPGITHRIGFHYTNIYGYFESMPADNLMHYSVGVQAGSILDNNGSWGATGVMKDYSSNVTANTSVQFKTENVSDGLTFVAGETYTLAPLVRLPSYNIHMSSSNGPATFVKGFDIYLRTLDTFDINKEEIYVQQNVHGVKGSPVKVDSSQISEIHTAKGLVLKISLPNTVLNTVSTSNFHAQEDAYLQDTTFNLIYSFAVDPFATTSVHKTSELFWVQPNTAYASSPVVVITERSITDMNQKDIYNVDNDSDEEERFGTLSENLNFTIMPQNAFLTKTSARVLIDQADSGWQTATAKSDAMGVTPFADEITYRLLVENTSGRSATHYVAHIPIPKEGEGISSGFKSTFTNAAEFGWTANLIEEIAIPHLSGATVKVTYSTSYVSDTRNANGFESWNSISDKTAIRTVRVEYSGAAMVNWAAHTYTVPLETARGNNGDINYYSSMVSYTLTGSVEQTNRTSQAVAMQIYEGAIIGRVYKDNDRDGNFGSGDVGISNVKVNATVTGGTSYTNNGGEKVLAPAYTDSNGYFMFVLADDDVATLAIDNPAYGKDNMLRFYGDNSVKATKTLSSINASASKTDKTAGDTGLIPPYEIKFDDNRTSGGVTFAVTYRYADEALFGGTPEVTGGLSGVPTASTLAGYTFDRWYSEKDNSAGGIAPDGYSTATHKDITFYAIRAPKKATVEYYVNTPGNTNPNDLSELFASDTFTFGEVMTATSGYPTAPQKYTARAGVWYTTPVRAQQNESTRWNFNKPYMIDSTDTIRLYAAYDPYVKVTFNPNGGSLPNNISQTFEVPRNTVITSGTSDVAQRTPPTKGSEIFEYWINSNGGGRVDFNGGFRVEQDTEFIAVWTGYVNYSVHHYIEGTTTSVMPSRTGSSMVGSRVSGSAHSALTGYTVVGATSKQITLSSDPNANNIIFYYRLLTYTVTFKDHDGTQLGSQTVSYGGSATAPSLPSHNEYRFVRWDKDFSNIQSNLTVTAICDPIVNTPDEPDDPPVTPPDDNTPNNPGGGDDRTIQERLDAQEGKSIFDSLRDGDVPLGNFTIKNAWSLLNLVLALITLVGAVVLLTDYVLPRRKKEDEEEQRVHGTYYKEETEPKEQRKRPFSVAFILSILFGILSFILFLVLENIRNPMIWINQFTLIFIVVALIFSAMVIWQAMTRKKKSSLEEQEEIVDPALSI